jgi:hypothetical protein
MSQREARRGTFLNPLILLLEALGLFACGDGENGPDYHWREASRPYDSSSRK